MIEKIALYPGTFDPVTVGHLDVIEISSKIFDKVIVAISTNINKTPMFEEVDRQEMMKEEIKKLHLKNISVVIHYGLTANLARSLKAISIIRGLRLTTDYESELDISFNNRILSNGVPFSAQYTNPERIASERLDCGYAILPQPDPNGLFMPSSSSATWLLMIDPKSDKPRPVYIEQEITVSPFELVYGIEK